MNVLPKIVDARYRKFLDEQIITLMTRTEFEAGLNTIFFYNKRKEKESRALAILSFYTGLRPIEVLALKPENFKDSEQVGFVKIVTTIAKRGKGTTIFLPNNKLVKEATKYALSCLPESLIFWSYNKEAVTKKVRYVSKKTGELIEKTYSYKGKNLHYFFKKHFGVTPYFLRHNCFSFLSQNGASDRELFQRKGAKSYESILPYLHMSREQAVATAKRQRSM